MNLTIEPTSQPLKLLARSATSMNFIYQPPWVDQMREARKWLEGIREARRAQSWFEDE